MPAGSSLVLATVVALVFGVSATVWLRWVRQKREETLAGLRALTDMRWRDFTRLVVEALQARGCEPEGLEQALERGVQSELRLRRDGRTWLLSCRQSAVDSELPVATVKPLADAVRMSAAGGGILATPGRVSAEARKVAGELEFYDGQALWDLVGPLLPPSLRDDLSTHARKRTLRDTAIAWAGAVALGLVAGFVPMLLTGTPAPADTVAPAAVVAKPAPVAAHAAEPQLSAAAPADPNREQFERSEVIRTVGALAWVERVMWSTASTLWVHQRDAVTEAQVQEVCAILSRYDALRASRLQLQPPPGSQEKVRFLQCRAY